jgi:CD2 antigen cytoplasmic tail-binding protein 2
LPAFADTEFVEDVEQIEEGLEEEEDEGVALEPFNLARERQEGYFDEGGHYVEHKREGDEENDAWLASEEGAGYGV